MRILPELSVEIFNEIQSINDPKVDVWFRHKPDWSREEASVGVYRRFESFDHMQWSIDCHGRTPDRSGRAHQSIGGGINR
jgi:hypothetical protein